MQIVFRDVWIEKPLRPVAKKFGWFETFGSGPAPTAR